MHEMMADRSKRNRATRDVRASSAQHHRFSEDQDTNAKVGAVRLQQFLNSVLQHSKDFKEYPFSLRTLTYHLIE